MASLGFVGIQAFMIPLMVVFLRRRTILLVVSLQIAFSSLSLIYSGWGIIAPILAFFQLTMGTCEIWATNLLYRKFKLSIAWANLLSPIIWWPLSTLLYAGPILLVIILAFMYMPVQSVAATRSVIQLVSSPTSATNVSSSPLIPQTVTNTVHSVSAHILSIVPTAELLRDVMIAGFAILSGFLFVISWVPFKILRNIERRLPELESYRN